MERRSPLRLADEVLETDVNGRCKDHGYYDANEPCHVLGRWTNERLPSERLPSEQTDDEEQDAARVAPRQLTDDVVGACSMFTEWPARQRPPSPAPSKRCQLGSD